jgi:hypothetical protein
VSTRLQIIQKITEWVDSDGDDVVPSSLFWLHGGAGVGKSALAQSLSENFQKRKQLAASFFFFRSDAARNNGERLIPTLVSHLVHTFKGIAPFVEDRIRDDWDLFTKRYQTQIQELLVILRFRPPEGEDQPYAQLDGLYGLIFLDVESRSQLEKICLVLGILYFESEEVGFFGNPSNIEDLLEMKAGDLVLLLGPILSLVAIDVDDDDEPPIKVRILHKSLFDYLLDSTRSGHLPFDLARVHESAATYILKWIVSDVCRTFLFHRSTPYSDSSPLLKIYSNFEILSIIANMRISMTP